METLAFEITWDPGIRGILVVLTAVAVLCGSVYLLLATNLGSRLGFLTALAGLFGWVFLMAIVWWIYGIGYAGTAPSWQVREVITSDAPDDLSAAGSDAVEGFPEGWREVPAGDPARGEAEATATEAITGDSPVALFESNEEFVVIDAWATGGKDPDSLVSRLPLPHPPHYTVVQVQQALPRPEVPFGEPPAPLEADPEGSVVSVLMVRDQGSLRLPPALIALASGVIFVVLCYVLHRRDQEVARGRAQAEVGAGD